jgi:hypothetical protein
MGKLFLLFTGLIFTQIIYAQQTIVSSGGNTIGSGGSVSYSVGQLVYTTESGTNGSVTQGVQQAIEIIVLGTDNFPEIKLMMSVFPNPTTAFVNLKIEEYSTNNLHYQLYDINGKQIQNQKITTSETQISMEDLAKSIYLLNVLDNNKLLKTFKIIKN